MLQDFFSTRKHYWSSHLCACMTSYVLYDPTPCALMHMWFMAARHASYHCILDTHAIVHIDTQLDGCHACILGVHNKLAAPAKDLILIMKAYLHEVWELLAKRVFLHCPKLAIAVLDEVRLRSCVVLCHFLCVCRAASIGQMLFGEAAILPNHAQ